MDETTPPKARLRGSLLVLPIFAAGGSLWFFFFKDCFFSVPIYDSLFWAIPCLLFLSSTPWFILIFRKLHRQNYVIANEHRPDSRRVVHPLSSALFVSLIAGFALLPFIGVGALGAVYISSTNTVTFPASIDIRTRGGTGWRSCRWFLTFDNRPIEREITICADYRGLSGAKSGDVLIFEEKAGPLGARLIGIQRKLN
jgi:hypothetical protein